MENKNKGTTEKLRVLKSLLPLQLNHKACSDPEWRTRTKEPREKLRVLKVESIEQCVTRRAESQGLKQSGRENKNKGTKRKVESIEQCVVPLTQQQRDNLANLVPASRGCTDSFVAISQRCLEKVMQVLAEPNAHLIGVYGSNHELKHALTEKVSRRVLRDKLFDRVLTVTVSKKPDVKKIQEEVTCQLRLTFNYKSEPDVKKIQEEIACQLGLTFKNKSKDKRARELIERLKIEQKILIILRDLHKGLDLGKVGIPYGSDHTGCKILLTSTTEDVLSNHMHAQHNFNIGS